MVTASSPPRGKRARPPAPALGKAARALLAQFDAAASPAMAEIAARWAEIVGPRLAQGCQPDRITGRGENGVLHVRARGAAGVLIGAESARIVERINTFAGRPIVRKLAITRSAMKPAAASPPPRVKRGLSPRHALELEQSLAHLSDKGLKAVLISLGAAVYARAEETTADRRDAAPDATE